MITRHPPLSVFHAFNGRRVPNPTRRLLEGWETASTIHIENYQTTKEGGHMPDEMNKREVILTIREYENSVAMPEGERVTYLDPRGGVHLKDGDDKALDYMRHAAKCAARSVPYNPSASVYAFW